MYVWCAGLRERTRRPTTVAMVHPMFDLSLAFELITKRNPKGLEPAMLYLEHATTDSRENHYKAQLVYWIIKSRLDLTPIIDRLRTAFLRDLDDMEDHGGRWFPWSAQLL